MFVKSLATLTSLCKRHRCCHKQAMCPNDLEGGYTRDKAKDEVEHEELIDESESQLAAFVRK